MSGLIEVVDVHKSYGSVKILKGLNFSVLEGETFAIIGPNGAGKTTLFKVMTGETPLNSGQIRFRGRGISSDPPHIRTRGGFGRTFQVARVFLELTVLENVVVAIEARQKASHERKGRWYDWRPAADVRARSHAASRRAGPRALGASGSQVPVARRQEAPRVRRSPSAADPAC